MPDLAAAADALFAPLVCPRCLADGAGEHSLGAEASGACSSCGLETGRTRGGAPVVLPEDSPAATYYEDPVVVSEYLAFHFPDPACDPLAALLGEQTPPLTDRFPFCIPRLVREAHGATGTTLGRALDLGCATGAVSLGLAAFHQAVTGIDRSPALIDAAQAVVATGRARYSVKLEGDLRTEHDLALPGAIAARPRVRFLVGDALAVPFRSGSFATVTALNLLDRVPDPARALTEAARLVEPGGVLVVSSPYTWLEAYAKKERWLGGVIRGGAPVRGRQTVIDRLAPELTHLCGLERPFFIPHHARTGQLGLALVDLFRRES